MPYSIVRRKDKFYVENADSGELRPAGGYATREEAKRYLAALEANVADANKASLGQPSTLPELYATTYQALMDTTGNEMAARLGAQGALHKARYIGIKSNDADGATIAGWALIFTDPNNPDLKNTYFPSDSADTLLLDNYQNAPLFEDHGRDPQVGDQPIGERSATKLYPYGVWLEHKLYPDAPGYGQRVQDIQDGLYAYSSDSIEHLVEQGLDPADGALHVWPMSACSITKDPAEPGLGPITLGSYATAMKSMAARREAKGVEVQRTASKTKLSAKGNNMDPVLQKIASFLGLPSTASPQDVVKAVNQYCSQMTSSGKADAALMDAMGLPPNTPPNRVAGTLKGMVKKALDGMSRKDDGGDDTSADTTADTAAMSGWFKDMASDGDAGAGGGDISDAYVSGSGADAAMDDLSGGTDVEGMADGTTGDVSAQALSVPPVDPTVLQAQTQQYGRLGGNFNRTGMNYQSLKEATALARKGRSNGGRDGLPFMVSDRANQTREYTTRPQFNISKNMPYLPVSYAFHDMVMASRGFSARKMLGAKAMSYSTGPTGGYILEQEISEDIIDPLRADAVVFKAGARQEDLDGIQVKTIPAMLTAPSAYWPGEANTVTTSQPVYRMISLVPKPLAVLVQRPFNYFKNMMPRGEQQLKAQIVKSLLLEIDRVCLLGEGGAGTGGNTGSRPLGLLNIPNITVTQLGNTDPVVNANGRAPTLKDMVAADGVLDDANIPQGGNRAWIFHSRSKRAFTGLTDSLGRPLLRESWGSADPDREILGYPYFVETQVPTNVTTGTNTDTSYIFFGSWEYMVVGLTTRVELVLDQTYAAQLLQGLLAYVYVDVIVEYVQAFNVLSGVRGA